MLEVVRGYNRRGFDEYNKGDRGEEGTFTEYIIRKWLFEIDVR